MKKLIPIFLLLNFALAQNRSLSGYVKDEILYNILGYMKITINIGKIKVNVYSLLEIKAFQFHHKLYQRDLLFDQFLILRAHFSLNHLEL